MPSDKRVGPHTDFQIAGMRCTLKDHYGPASYLTATKDQLNPNDYELDEIAAVKVLSSGVTVSTGAFYGDVRAIKTQEGPYSTWKLIWYSDAAGTEVVNTTDISTKRCTIEVYGN